MVVSRTKTSKAVDFHAVSDDKHTTSRITNTRQVGTPSSLSIKRDVRGTMMTIVIEDKILRRVQPSLRNRSFVVKLEEASIPAKLASGLSILTLALIPQVNFVSYFGFERSSFVSITLFQLGTGVVRFGCRVRSGVRRTSE